MVFVCVSCDCVLRIYSWIEILVKKLSSHLFNLCVTIPFLLSCCCHSCCPHLLFVCCYILISCAKLFHEVCCTSSCVQSSVALAASSALLQSSLPMRIVSLLLPLVQHMLVLSFSLSLFRVCFHVFAELRPQTYLHGSPRIFADDAQFFFVSTSDREDNQ